MGSAVRTAPTLTLERAHERRARPASEKRTSRWIVVGTLLTILAVAATAGIQLRRDHELALAQAEHEATSFTVVAGNLIAASIDGIRAQIAAAMKTSSAPAIVAGNPALLNVMLVDGDGTLIWDKSGATAETRRIGDVALLA